MNLCFRQIHLELNEQCYRLIRLICRFLASQIMRSVFAGISILCYSAVFCGTFSSTNAFSIILHFEETPVANKRKLHRERCRERCNLVTADEQWNTARAVKVISNYLGYEWEKWSFSSLQRLRNYSTLVNRLHRDERIYSLDLFAPIVLLRLSAVDE